MRVALFDGVSRGIISVSCQPRRRRDRAGCKFFPALRLSPPPPRGRIRYRNRPQNYQKSISVKRIFDRSISLKPLVFTRAGISAGACVGAECEDVSDLLVE